MRDWPALLIAALWLIWIAYWVIAARAAKRVEAREPLLGRLVFLAAMLLVAVLIGGHRWPQWLMQPLIPGGWARYWFAVSLVIVGLGFSIWARMVLGANWSGVVAVKVDHELVMDGPYRWVRHPIYTGALMALLGSGLAAGQARGLVAFLIALLALWLKSRAEERWMLREFAERYAAYRRTTWALLPLVL
ncbi:MAG TPA: isoprenylcysteine carboxylmethyltransferase family protein [Steroidobacteraceae bacterium]|jgi:protein-S-isoprenylcysteine O-methyltransferase Ste14|nr:isoprenylcysteine carboxylmethyltransferase family protein [Steroidobacteraceae bacterium]